MFVYIAFETNNFYFSFYLKFYSIFLKMVFFKEISWFNKTNIDLRKITALKSQWVQNILAQKKSFTQVN